MNRPLNKIIILTLCMAAYVQLDGGEYAVVPFIAAVTFTALCEYLPRDHWRTMLFVIFPLAASLYFPLVYFLPLASYDIWMSRPRWTVWLPAIPLVVHWSRPDPFTLALVVIYIGLACLMKYQTEMLQKQRNDSIALRDNAKELSTGLIERNRDLLEKQDYEINLATLRERNRIAREMHDTVGHLLSSSILQTGALLATCRDEAQRQGLQRLQSTLSQGMDNVRSGIHDLHDESVDLFAELQTLADSFTFCPVSFDYDVVESPGKKIKYAFVAIVKEALANVAKHSNATHVNIAVLEHPALYQLVIRDNGSSINKPVQDTGLGLKNIAQRVEAVGGLVNIRAERGFELFVSVKKDDSEQKEVEA